MPTDWMNEAASVLGEGRVLFDPASLEKHSKDYFWYSPVLDRQLKHKLAEGIVIPVNELEVEAILSLAYRNRVPLTVRGSGTGNYGQAVPLQGGIVMDMSGLNQIMEIGPGYARVQSGVHIGALEKKVRASGQDLCIYPSTFVKSTIGGFVSGGSGGIGSITWGNLWDGNVLEAAVYTLEEKPRRLTIRGEDLFNYIHNYGTTGITTELVIRLVPRREWVQTIAHFDTFENALLFSGALSRDAAIAKRLVSALEWPIPSLFKPLSKVLEAGAAAVLMETAEGTQESVAELAKAHDGRIGHVIPSKDYRKTPGISDSTWNHTTLWALKTDPGMTYLQADFSIENVLDQIKQLKAKFGDEVLHHIEWIHSGGRLTPTSLPLVKYTGDKRLYEIIASFESLGVIIYDPHTWLLDGGGRGEIVNLQRKKRENDPSGLLNPGKLRNKGE